MTIVIHWWYLPAALVIAAIAGAALWPNSRWGYGGWADHVFWGLGKIAFVAGCLLVALGVTIGWLSSKM